MKSTFAIFAIFSFTTIAVFGFLAIGHNIDGEHAGCLAAVASRQTDCPDVFNPISEAIFHTSAFKNFSKAITGFYAVFLAALLCLGAIFRHASQKFGNLNFTPAFQKHFVLTPDSYRERVLSWISRFQNSPSRK